MTAQLPIDGLNAESISTNRPEEVSFDQETGQLTWTIGDLEYKNPFAKATVQIVISIGAIIGCLAGPLIGGWMGRRPAYFLLCASSLVICAFLFRGLEVYNATFVVMAGLAGAATASFYGWLPLYLPELFPTRVRATGQGLSFNFGRILAAFGAIYAGQLVTFFEGMYPGEGYARSGATITLVYALGCILIWLAPETKGKPLPE
jgi:MFS family permease